MEKSENIGQRMLEMELSGKRTKGRPQRISVTVLKEDMETAGVTVEAVGDWVRGRQMNP